MKYSHLQSLFGSLKSPMPLKVNAALSLAPDRLAPYIPPTLRKEIFDVEKPAVLLISAVGATGKSTLAQVLASSTQLPLLDLSKHKAVGDSSLSGLLTNSFLPSDLGKVIAGLSDGTYGLIVDGLDEGRSKTTEAAFEAFLDDMVNLCAGARRPSFILLGRTAAVEACWMHLESRGIATGLLSIEPFDLQQANEYIDQLSGQVSTAHAQQYAATKELILSSLSSAFSSSSASNDGSFLSFIGYPPVLDAVATLLRNEGNFHRIQTE